MIEVLRLALRDFGPPASLGAVLGLLAWAQFQRITRRARFDANATAALNAILSSPTPMSDAAVAAWAYDFAEQMEAERDRRLK